MTFSRDAWIASYQAALRRYVAEKAEAALEVAYDLGRQAAIDGWSVLEIVEAHHSEVANLVRELGPGAQSGAGVQAAEDFLMQGLAPFEMTRRGFQEAIEALRQSQEHLRTVVAHAPIVFFSVDVQGTFTLSEGKALSVLKFQPGEVVGRSVFELYRETPAVIEGVQRALAGEAFTTTVEVNGLFFETHYAPIREADGVISSVIGVATDITERVRAEEALRKTLAELEGRNQELESFTYSVSHDLREPLRTVESFSQFLLEDYAGQLDEQGRDYLTRMGKASNRMKQMIEELLALSRLSRRPEELVPVNVGQVVTDIATAFSATLAESGGRIEVAPELPCVLGDLSRVEQIFGNLIANGIKFNQSEQPAVKIGVHEINGRTVTFFVHDDGIGIDPQYHDKIFEVFQRLHRREAYDGTGAGLAIVRRAVEALGGSVRVDSALGAGATFFVSLPLWREIAVAA